MEKSYTTNTNNDIKFDNLLSDISSFDINNLNFENKLKLTSTKNLKDDNISPLEQLNIMLKIKKHINEQSINNSQDYNTSLLNSIGFKNYDDEEGTFTEINPNNLQKYNTALGEDQNQIISKLDFSNLKVFLYNNQYPIDQQLVRKLGPYNESDLKLVNFMDLNENQKKYYLSNSIAWRISCIEIKEKEIKQLEEDILQKRKDTKEIQENIVLKEYQKDKSINDSKILTEKADEIDKEYIKCSKELEELDKKIGYCQALINNYNKIENKKKIISPIKEVKEKPKRKNSTLLSRRASRSASPNPSPTKKMPILEDDGEINYITINDIVTELVLEKRRLKEIMNQLLNEIHSKKIRIVKLNETIEILEIKNKNKD